MLIYSLVVSPRQLSVLNTVGKHAYPHIFCGSEGPKMRNALENIQSFKKVMLFLCLGFFSLQLFYNIYLETKAVKERT